ncbi:uncharacterized protein LOC144443701 [Glandiceps talaboti]
MFGNQSAHVPSKISRQRDRLDKKSETTDHLTSLPFMRVSNTVKRHEESQELTGTKKKTRSSDVNFEQLLTQRSHLIDSSNRSLDEKIGLLASRKVTRDGYTSKSTLDLLNLAREDLPAPRKLRTRNKEKKATTQDIFKHIAQLKRKQAAFDWTRNPGLPKEGEVKVTRDDFLELPLSLRGRREIDTDQPLLQNWLTERKETTTSDPCAMFGVNSQSSEGNAILDMNSSIFEDQKGVFSSFSQQVPTNSPLMPNFLQQSPLVYSDSSTANASVPHFYDQASFWMKKEDMFDTCINQEHTLIQFPADSGHQTCSHDMPNPPEDEVMTSGVNGNENTENSPLQPVSSCGPQRHQIED